MNEKNKVALDKLQEQLERKFGIDEEQERLILSDDLADCLAEALDYCNRDDLEGNMVSSVKDLYIVKRNREGSEGEISRSEGGVSRSYEEGIPEAIRTKLNRYRLASLGSFL